MSNPKRRFPPLTVQTNLTNDAMTAKRARDGPIPQTPMPPYRVLHKEVKPSHKDARTSGAARISSEQKSSEATDAQKQEPTLAASAQHVGVGTEEQDTKQAASRARPSTCQACTDKKLPCPGGHPRCRYCVDKNLACLY